jgi:uncharacterized protein YdaU (DUF1376 family)
MHYYQFNIGDYVSHTSHLDDLEDLAYRRMLDYCYLNECGLPETVEEVARVIRMRTHSVCIANVLHEFFYQHTDMTWRNKRIDDEIAASKGKSEKAASAARKRWQKTDADALPTHSERNANAMRTQCQPLTINHKPITKESRTTTRPTVDEVAEYVSTRPVQINPQAFVDYYTANGWKVGRNSMKDWRAAVRTWEKNENGKTAGRQSIETIYVD